MFHRGWEDKYPHKSHNRNSTPLHYSCLHSRKSPKRLSWRPPELLSRPLCQIMWSMLEEKKRCITKYSVTYPECSLWLQWYSERPQLTPAELYVEQCRKRPSLGADTNAYLRTFKGSLISYARSLIKTVRTCSSLHQDKKKKKSQLVDNAQTNSFCCKASTSGYKRLSATQVQSLVGRCWWWEQWLHELKGWEKKREYSDCNNTTCRNASCCGRTAFTPESYHWQLTWDSAWSTRGSRKIC